MKKTVIALAILSSLGAVGTAAQAQTSVTFYGQLNPSYDYVKVTESPLVFVPGVKTNYTSMSSNASFIGFRGTEDLGGGLKAIFQLESNFDMVNDNGFTKVPSTNQGDRDSFVGLEGRLGKLRVGAMDGVYKRITASYDPFADSIGDYNSIMGIGAMSIFIPAVNNNTTYKQAIDYVSPSFNGIQLMGTYALTTAKTSGGATDQNESRWDLGVTYTNGPLNLLASYSRAKDLRGYFPPEMLSDTTWFKVGAAYTFATGTTVRAIVEKVKFDVAQWKFYDQRHFLVGVEHPINNIDLMANYINAGNNHTNTLFSGVSNSSGAHAFNLGARYNFSKRTNVMAAYTYLKNSAMAGYSSNAGYAGYPNIYDPEYGMVSFPGTTITGVSLRLQHKF